MSSTIPHLPGGTWTLGDTTVSRFGYGAMQLAGPWVVGPPNDRDEALAVLRDAVASGITHIDTVLVQDIGKGPLKTWESPGHDDRGCQRHA